MTVKLLFLGLLLSQTVMAGRIFKASILPLNYATVVLNNVGDISQQVKVTFRGSGNAVLAKHPGMLDPTPVVLTCALAGQYTCSLSNFVTLAPGKNLTLGIVATYPTPPLAADIALNLEFEVAESAGAISVFAQSQIIYVSGSGVQVNVPMPVPINGGRPI